MSAENLTTEAHLRIMREVFPRDSRLLSETQLTEVVEKTTDGNLRRRNQGGSKPLELTPIVELLSACVAFATAYLLFRTEKRKTNELEEPKTETKLSPEAQKKIIELIERELKADE